MLMPRVPSRCAWRLLTAFAIFLAPLLAMTSGCGQSPAPATAGSASSAPTPPSLPPPPPAHVISLAAPAASQAADAASLDALLGKLTSATPELEASLSSASFDGAAPSSLVVLGGGRQSEVARPEIPRHQRWEIRFGAGTSIEAYARQMDFFKIELGVIGGQDTVTYLTNLSNPKPETRPGQAAEDERLYLIWQRGAIREADEQIATRAGIKAEGRVLAHFLPKAIEDELVRLEDAFAKQLGITKIGKTVFGIRSSGQDSFRFFVIEQKADQR